MAKQTVPPLPLPKGWPRRVRSAAVHAIALARLALTTACGQAREAGTEIAAMPGRPLPGQDFHLLEQRTFHGTRGPLHRIYFLAGTGWRERDFVRCFFMKVVLLLSRCFEPHDDMGLGTTVKLLRSPAHRRGFLGDGGG